LVCHIKGTTQDRIFEVRVLRRTFGPKREEVTGDEENYIRSFIIF
jgi:hypothetical protein